MRFKSRVAIVTGAGSGFGEAIAAELAAEGASVLIVDLNGEAAERVAGALCNKSLIAAANLYTLAQSLPSS